MAANPFLQKSLNSEFIHFVADSVYIFSTFKRNLFICLFIRLYEKYQRVPKTIIIKVLFRILQYMTTEIIMVAKLYKA